MQPQLADDRPEHELVSYHAVARYCERILHIDLPPIEASPREIAEAYACAAQLTLDEVRRLIWTPGVRFASQFGVLSVSNGHFAAVFSQPAGVVTTVLTPFVRDAQRMRVLTDRELRQKARRTERCLKRRPSATDAQQRRGPNEEEE